MTDLRVLPNDRRDESRAYRAAHREEISAYKTAYNAAHKEEKQACAAAWYMENREAIREKDKRDHAEFVEWLQILRTNNGCEDCETHEGRLEHHHVDPDTKRYDISRMYTNSLDTLEEELEKCVVLCDPCHRRRHVEMRAA